MSEDGHSVQVSFGGDWVRVNGTDLSEKEGHEWTLIEVDPDRDLVVGALCHNLGAAVFVPVVPHPSGEFMRIYPGHVFARVTNVQREALAAEEELKSIRTLANATGELENVKRFADALGAADIEVDIGKSYKTGDLIQFLEGPFKGIEGWVVEQRGRSRVLVALTVIGEGLEVDIHTRAIRPVGEPEPERVLTLTSVDLADLVRPVNDELVKYLSNHPDFLHRLDPRRFELLVAELLRDMGYDVIVTPPGKDGGRDILAEFMAPAGKFLTVVECKRYASHRKIGVNIVERLLWVAQQYDRSSGAMLATTSTFTAGALKIEEQFRWRLQLKGMQSLKEWLGTHGSWKSAGESSIWVPQRAVDLIS